MLIRRVQKILYSIIVVIIGTILVSQTVLILHRMYPKDPIGEKLWKNLRALRWKMQKGKTEFFN